MEVWRIHPSGVTRFYAPPPDGRARRSGHWHETTSRTIGKEEKQYNGEKSQNHERVEGHARKSSRSQFSFITKGISVGISPAAPFPRILAPSPPPSYPNRSSGCRCVVRCSVVVQCRVVWSRVSVLREGDLYTYYIYRSRPNSTGQPPIQKAGGSQPNFPRSFYEKRGSDIDCRGGMCNTKQEKCQRTSATDLRIEKKRERKCAFRPIFPKRSSATPKPKTSGGVACVSVVTAERRLAQEAGKFQTSAAIERS